MTATAPMTPESDVVVWEGAADSGFLVFPAAPEGDYWVVETDAPTGFHTAPPMLVRHELTEEHRDCIVVGEQTELRADDDQSGGFLLVFVHDTPADLPPTDERGGEAAGRTVAERHRYCRHRRPCLLTRTGMSPARSSGWRTGYPGPVDASRRSGGTTEVTTGIRRVSPLPGPPSRMRTRFGKGLDGHGRGG